MTDTELEKQLKQAEINFISAKDAALASYESGLSSDQTAEIERVRGLWADYKATLQAWVDAH